MKKFFAFTILLSTLSCSTNQYEDKLIGQWNNFPIGGMSDFKFFKDSVVSFEYGQKRIGKWKANATDIRIHLRKTVSLPQKEHHLYYALNTNGDSLLLKNNDKEDISNFLLLKVNNHWEHYLKELELKIELPIPNFEIHKMDNSKFGIDIYIGYENNLLVAKTIRGVKLRNTKKVAYLVYSTKSEITPQQAEELSFNLIVDKHVPERKIDSIKHILKEFPEINIFRVYHTELENYGKYNVNLEGRTWEWYGTQE